VTIAVIVFPGTNCELDAQHALRTVGASAELVWHRDTDLSGAEGVVLPGGFAHGDYLRTGAIARFSPVMREVERLASIGVPTLGICNGFQILCEAGILPGALIANRDLKFLCKPVYVRVESTHSILTAASSVGDILRIPLNSFEGNYITQDIEALEGSHQITLRYCDAEGNITAAANPNGSTNAIAAVTNHSGNVVGVMPHPERAIEDILGSSDGRALIEAFVTASASVPA
jgi:phosphoribosylformylglycinamidine synthase subunit PurQ / glutaminase